MSIISNTTVLSNFAAIDSLGRLRALYGEIFLSTEDARTVACGRGFVSGDSTESELAASD